MSELSIELDEGSDVEEKGDSAEEHDEPAEEEEEKPRFGSFSLF